MKIVISVITPLGKFESKEMTVDDEEYAEIKALLKDANSMSYLSLETNGGVTYIPGNVLKQSVVLLHHYPYPNYPEREGN